MHIIDNKGIHGISGLIWFLIFVYNNNTEIKRINLLQHIECLKFQGLYGINILEKLLLCLSIYFQYGCHQKGRFVAVWHIWGFHLTSDMTKAYALRNNCLQLVSIVGAVQNFWRDQSSHLSIFDRCRILKLYISFNFYQPIFSLGAQ